MTREEEFQSKVLHKLVKLETYHEFYVKEVEDAKRTADEALSKANKVDTKLNTTSSIFGVAITALAAFLGIHK